MATLDFTDKNSLNNRQQEIDLGDKIKFAILIGCGGIGSWVGLDLALSGRVENLYLIDGDIVEDTNLNRTPFRIVDIGVAKVDALKYLILERRVIDIMSYQQKSTKFLADTIRDDMISKDGNLNNDMSMFESTVIVDCRDDLYDDFYHLKSKYYKLGYDGLEITMDGNPKNTPVWGRANTYRFTPSFICPAQLVANIVVNDILTNQIVNTENKYKDYKCDEYGRLNDSFTIGTQFLMRELYMLSKKGNT